MRASIYYFALAGLTSLSQASPIADPDPHTDPRGLITRSLSNLLTPDSETLPTKRQAIPPAKGDNGFNAGFKTTRDVTLVIEKGDTLGQLSKLFNSGICDIAKLNNIADPNFILAGATLKVTINVANPDNNSCLKGGAATTPPPATNSTGGGKKDQPAKPGKGGKTTKRSANLFARDEDETD